MSSVIEAFATFMEAQGFGTKGEDIFISRAPDSDRVPDAVYWLKAYGGTPARKVTGEAEKSFQIQVFYRNRNANAVYDRMFELESILNCGAGCTDIPGYEVTEINAITLPSDQDLDDEDREVGLLQAQLKIYATC